MQSEQLKLVFASHNENKIREVQQILGVQNYQIIGLADLGFHKEILEDAPDLSGNALIKSRTIHAFSKLPVFSDDTGLEVYALNMEPGVFTARYAGPQKNSLDNMNLLLKELKGIKDRRARFRTVIALILDDEEFLFEGIVEGNIAYEISGTEGFGYDPVFIPESHSRSFADMDISLKNSMSHRYRALIKMRDFFNKKG